MPFVNDSYYTKIKTTKTYKNYDHYLPQRLNASWKWHIVTFQTFLLQMISMKRFQIIIFDDMVTEKKNERCD